MMFSINSHGWVHQWNNTFVHFAMPQVNETLWVIRLQWLDNLSTICNLCLAPLCKSLKIVTDVPISLFWNFHICLRRWTEYKPITRTSPYNHQSCLSICLLHPFHGSIQSLWKRWYFYNRVNLKKNISCHPQTLVLLYLPLGPNIKEHYFDSIHHSNCNVERTISTDNKMNEMCYEIYQSFMTILCTI